MRRHVLFSLLFLISAAFSYSQTTLTLTEKNGSNINKQVVVFEDESLNSHIDALKLPNNVKEALLADMEQNYKPGNSYQFSIIQENKTYTIDVLDRENQNMIKGDEVIIENNRNWKMDQPQIFVGGSKAFLGVSYGAFEFKKDEARKHVRGVVVNNVVEGEAAYNAGLEKGDVITKINGMETPSPSLFKDAVNELQPRDKVVFTINRDGKVMQLESIAGKRSIGNFWQGGNQNIFPFHYEEFNMDDLDSKEFNFSELDFDNMGMNKAHLGVMISDHEKGVEISSVQSNTAAEEAGLQKGDIITEVDGMPINTAKALSEYIQSKEIGEKVKIQYLRDGKRKTTTAKLKKSQINFYFQKERN